VITSDPGSTLPIDVVHAWCAAAAAGNSTRPARPPPLRPYVYSQDDVPSPV
jgi:hypothetical protein